MKESIDPFHELSADEKRELLKKLLQKRAEKEAGSSYPGIIADPEHRYEPFPLTDIQYAYWIGRTGIFELGSVGTHIYMEFETAALDMKRLNLAWQLLIQRHEMLRAIVLPEGLQKILQEVPVYEIFMTDWKHLPPGEIGQRLEANRRSMSHQVFQPDRWPLFEVRSFLTGSDQLRHCISFDLLFVDLMSFQVLIHEWFQLYQNPDVQLAPLPVSFRDYVLAVKRLKTFDIYQRAKDYWFKRLDTLPPSPELALAKSPGALKEYRFFRRHARLEPTRWRRLKQKAQELGLTPAAVLLTTFAETLTLWCKNPRFTLNLIIFNRLPLHEQINKIVGDFTSVNLLEIDHTENLSFTRRATLLQTRLWNDLEHRHISGVTILRELARLHGGSRAFMPVVFTCDIVQGITSSQDTLPSPIPMDYRNGISQTPQIFFDHQVFEDNGALTVNWDTVDELFPEGLLQEMFDANLRLLGRLAEEDELWHECNIQRLPMPQLTQRRQVNATDEPVPDVLLQDLFLRQAKQRPDHPAVITPGGQYTYQEIYARSCQLGHVIRDLGIGPNSLVAVVMDKGWEQVVGVLGILQAGAAYLPISPDNPTQRLWYLLENGAVSLVLTQSWLEESLEWPESVHRILVDTHQLSKSAAPPLAAIQKPEDLAYVIYTSGSTGTPKGVMIDHQGAVNTILDINRRMNIGPSDRVFAVSSLSFDLSVYDIFGTLAAGGAIVLPGPDSLQDPSHWAALMDQAQVTVWNSAPALMSMLVEFLQGRDLPLPGRLRHVMLSGDWIPVLLPGQIKSLSTRGDVQVTSLGGATEASIWSILYPIGEVDPTWDSIPYGRPMTNQQFYVLNSKMVSCPVWVPGTLYIGGKGLAKGYWKDEEKTKSRFILHPQTRERLYNTGDIGYYLPDGNIRFVGREDNQVKIRGHRIELGEIEATLERCPGVRQAFTKVTGEKTGPKRLYAYVVPEEGRESALFTMESVDARAHHLLMEAIRETGRQQSEKMPAEFGQLSGLLDSFNRISTAYMIQALRKLGAYHQAGEHYTIDEFVARFNIQPRYRSLVLHWLAELQQDGWLQKASGGVYSNLRALPVSSMESLWEEVDSFHGLAASKSTLLSYIKNCGENLPALLTGQIDPLEIFFKGGSRETAEELYQFNPFSEYINLLTKDILAAIVQNRHSPRDLNILEVGAGTGGTTAYLLPVLDPANSHYSFTDVSSFFIGPAKEKFSEYDFISYDLFNVEQDPASQGYALHSYDVIVAADVLHNVRDLPVSLEYLRTLLAPGGILLLIEATRNMRLQMITIGLLEEFTRSDRGGLPFLSIETWQQALVAGGYEGWELFPGPDSSMEALGVHVIVSSGPLSTRTFKKKDILYSLRERLPDYMIPSDLMYLKSAPLTTNGKIDRESLPVPNEQMSGSRKLYVAPRNATEQMLADLWVEVLPVDKAGIHDNFFELGGDSLIGIQLIAKANKMGLPLNPRELFQYQTIAELAPVIEQVRSAGKAAPPASEGVKPDASSALVTLQGKGNKTPIFCVHPSTGNIECYFELSRHLGRDRPFYGLQSRALVGGQDPHLQVEEMAAYYIDAIRTVQPEGPYLLGGWSSGGVVALEMARQLSKMGQVTERLLLIEIGAQDFRNTALDQGQVAYVTSLLEETGVYSPPPSPGEGRNGNGQAGGVTQLAGETQHADTMELIRSIQLLPAALEEAEVAFYLQLSQTHIRALQHHVIQPYEGRVVLFVAADRGNRETEPAGSRAEDPYLGWKRTITGELERYEVPGNHFSILKPPQVQVLARQLERSLALLPSLLSSL